MSRAMARVAARWSRLALPSAPCARSSLHCLDMGGGKPSWSMLHHAKCPPARVGHAQTAVDGKLFVFGGRTGVDMGETALDDLWSFCPVKSAWRQLSAGSPPSARSFHASAAAGSKLYVFGGCGAGVRLADLHEFDTASGAWKQLPSPPEVAGRDSRGLGRRTLPLADVRVCGARDGRPAALLPCQPHVGAPSVRVAAASLGLRLLHHVQGRLPFWRRGECVRARS